MERKKGYKFTNKKHTEKGIMSTLLGIISLVSIILAIYNTYLAKGEAIVNYGLVGLIATCFSVIGLALGALARVETDKFLVFAYIGLIINILVLICISAILCAGAYGIG